MTRFLYTRAFASSLLLLSSSLAAQAGEPEQGQTSALPTGMPEAALSISEADLERHGMTLASDDFEGRLTGTRGQVKAAEYFAKHFKKLGLRPWGDKKGGARDWFQYYPISHTGVRAEKTGLFAPNGDRVCKHGAWFVKTSKPREIKIKGKLVWCSLQDLRSMPLKGKIAVVPLPEPRREARGIMGAMSEGFRLMADVRARAKNAAAAGARACILVGKTMSVSFLSAANMMTAYPGRPEVARGRGRAMFSGRPPKIPTMAIDGEDATAVIKAIGLDPETAWASEVAVGKSSKAAYTIRAKPFKDKVKASNVAAVLRGSDPKLSKELVVFSCHMDHMGITANGGVFNGADDNASGCATVLEIAEAFAELPEKLRPKRSVMFLAVSGEELGLWGSDHFATNPTWKGPIVANINMDMLGRSTAKVPEDAVALTPTYKNGDYSTLARRAAALGTAFGLRMTNGDKFYQRSDHWNFAKQGIPVVFFCDDEHADYHMPSDTPDKLEYAKIQRIARLAFAIGYETANDTKRPEKLGKRADWFGDKGAKKKRK